MRIPALLLVVSFLRTGPALGAASNPPLIEAAKAGNLELVTAAIAKGASPAATDADGMNALDWAAAEGRTQVVAYLLDHGASINAQTSNVQETALVQAAQFGRLEVVKLLLDRGAKVDLKGKYGETALSALTNNVGVASAKTSQDQVYEIISLLLAHGADANVVGSNGESIVFMPAYANDLKLVSFLLKSKIRPDLKTPSGETALDYACRGQGDVEMFELLSKAGFKSGLGLDRCLVAAVVQSKPKLVEKLLPLATAPPYLLAMAAAGEHEADEQISLRLLEAKGADVNSVSETGLTVLHAAAMTDKPALAAALLSKGAHVSSSASGFVEGAPLHFAARYGSPEIVPVLLKAGAPVDEKNSRGETPLQFAVRGPIDHRTSDGPPPDWSKAPAYLKTIELLIAAGADPGLQNRAGLSATQLVEKAPNEDFRQHARALLKKGR